MDDFYHITEDGIISRADGVPLETLTLRQMCEFIASQNILTGNPTASQIYHYSPTGELCMIFEWYFNALEKSVRSKS